MKRVTSLVGMLLLWVAPVVAAQPEVDARAMDEVFGRLAIYEYGDDYTELAPIERAMNASHRDERLRADLERRLVGIVSGPAPNAAKDYACRALSVIGTGRSVAALAALLPDAELSGLARYALERIPDRAVDGALRDGLSVTSGVTKAGVINSLGIRRDEGSIKLMAGLLRDSDPIVVEAAALALGKIATPASARTLGQFRSEVPEAMRGTVEAAYLEAADRLLRGGNRRVAAGIFEELYRDHASGALHLAGFQGLVAARPREANERLLTALSADDVPVRRLAARLIAELPGRETPRLFLEALPELESDAQVSLLGALRFRGDSGAREVVLLMMEDADAEVRRAALDALGTVGSAEDVVVLAEVAAGGTAPVREAARNSLTTLSGGEVNEAILAAMAEAEGEVRVELLRSLIGRVARETVSKVAGHLRDDDVRVSVAAAEVLGAIGDERQIPELISHLGAVTSEPQRASVARALTSIAGREPEGATEGLLAGVREAGVPGKAVLMGVLPVIGGERALEVLRDGLKGKDGTVRDASVRALANWPEAEAAPDLIGIIEKTDSASHRVLAFRGYVRLCRAIEVTPAARLELLREVSVLARSVEDKRLIIAALGDVPTVESLRMVSEYLDDEALVNEAGAAVVKIAPGVGPGHQSEAVEVLQRVASGSGSKAIVDDARRAMERLERQSR
jgi:HEAT repeat protein